jgi:hypothetical protein
MKIVTVAILAQGTLWAVAVTQAFASFALGLRKEMFGKLFMAVQSVI